MDGPIFSSFFSLFKKRGPQNHHCLKTPFCIFLRIFHNRLINMHRLGVQLIFSMTNTKKRIQNFRTQCARTFRFPLWSFRQLPTQSYLLYGVPPTPTYRTESCPFPLVIQSPAHSHLSYKVPPIPTCHAKSRPLPPLIESHPLIFHPTQSCPF